MRERCSERWASAAVRQHGGLSEVYALCGDVDERVWTTAGGGDQETALTLQG